MTREELPRLIWQAILEEDFGFSGLTEEEIERAVLPVVDRYADAVWADGYEAAVSET